MASLSLQRFFSGAFIRSPVSRTRSGEWSAITKRTLRASQLDFCLKFLCTLATQRGAVDVGGLVANADSSGSYNPDEDRVKSGFEGEHAESNHRLMYT